jgi:hypothetical protein
MSERALPVVVQSGGEERPAETLARRPAKARDGCGYGPIQPSRRRLGGLRLRRVLLATSEVP